MKKIITILCTFLLLFTLIALPVMAEAVEPAVEEQAGETITTEPVPTPGELPSEFTWKYLATIAGATAATLLIVQFLKVQLDRVWKIPTRAFVYFIALMLLLAGTYFTTGPTPNTALLTAVNAVIVALTAYGSYEVTFARKNK